MKKLIVIGMALLVLSGCAGEKVGDTIETETQICVTTLEYKWVWSIWKNDTGFKKVPTTKCTPK